MQARVGWAALARQRTEPDQTCVILARMEPGVYYVVPYFIDYLERAVEDPAGESREGEFRRRG